MFKTAEHHGPHLRIGRGSFDPMVALQLQEAKIVGVRRSMETRQPSTKFTIVTEDLFITSPFVLPAIKQTPKT
jgi:hypothetical protein